MDNEFNGVNNPQPMQPPPPPYQPPQQKKGMAIASLVLGIVSLVFFCAWYLSIPCAIVGLILGIIANKKFKTGMATAGIILSIIGIVTGVTMAILAFTILPDMYRRMMENY